MDPKLRLNAFCPLKKLIFAQKIDFFQFLQLLVFSDFDGIGSLWVPSAP